MRHHELSLMGPNLLACLHNPDLPDTSLHTSHALCIIHYLSGRKFFANPPTTNGEGNSWLRSTRVSQGESFHETLRRGVGTSTTPRSFARPLVDGYIQINHEVGRSYR